MLRKKGFQVISINKPVEDTPSGRLLEAFIESLDEYYSDNLGEVVTRGMKERDSRDFYLSVKPPYGYRIIRTKNGNKDNGGVIVYGNMLGEDRYDDPVIAIGGDNIVVHTK